MLSAFTLTQLLHGFPKSAYQLSVRAYVQNGYARTDHASSYAYSKEKILWATTKIFSYLSKGKTIPVYALKIYPALFQPKKRIGDNYTWLCAENLSPHFFSRKNAVVTTENFIPSFFMAKNEVFECLKSKEFTGCSNFCEEITRKKKAGKGR